MKSSPQLRLVSINGIALAGEDGTRSQSIQFDSNARDYCDTQLELPLAGQEKIHSFAMDFMHGAIFRDWLYHIGPRTVIDFRLISVFDQPAYSRDRAMADFQQLKAEFLVVPIDLRDGSGKTLNYLQTQAENVFQSLESYGVNIKPPIAALFSTADHIELFSVYLDGITDRILSLESALEQA